MVPGVCVCVEGVWVCVQQCSFCSVKGKEEKCYESITFENRICLSGVSKQREHLLMLFYGLRLLIEVK